VDGLLDSLRRAVEAEPTNIAVRVHLAELLIDQGEATDQ
jgi:hypothetical protein